MPSSGSPETYSPLSMMSLVNAPYSWKSAPCCSGGAAALADAPRRLQLGADGAGEVAGELLGGAPEPRRRLDDVAQQAPLGGEGVDDGAADEVGGRTGHREQGRRDEATARAFGHADRLVAAG